MGTERTSHMAQLQGRHPRGPSLREPRRPESSAPARLAAGSLLGRDMPISIAALDQAAVLDLQRTVGNRAVTAILEREKLKPGLNVQRAIGWKTAEGNGDAVSD